MESCIVEVELDENMRRKAQYNGISFDRRSPRRSIPTHVTYTEWGICDCGGPRGPQSTHLRDRDRDRDRARRAGLAFHSGILDRSSISGFIPERKGDEITETPRRRAAAEMGLSPTNRQCPTPPPTVDHDHHPWRSPTLCLTQASITIRSSTAMLVARRASARVSTTRPGSALVGTSTGWR